MDIRTSTNIDTERVATRRKPRAKQKKRRIRWGRAVLLSGLVTIFLGLCFSVWFFLTDTGSQFRYLMADSLITTQHRHWAKYLIGEEGLNQRVQETMSKFEEWTETTATHQIFPPAPQEKKKELVEIKEISGDNWKGHLLIVNDPKAIRIVVPEKVGKGEKVSSMVKRTGAIAGVNAGGFLDPEWKGNGFQPTGLVISNGQIIYNDGSSDVPVSIVGIDKDGKMVAGKYRPSELLKMGVAEAVTFSPKFINDGKGLVKNHADGWGIAPRTSMAQKADGTIMFAIIDGRQPHSIGATLYDIQNVFLEEGAVIAANLDGGSSTVLVHNDQIVNKPASPYGERYLPTAFLVFKDPQAVNIKNIWQGIDMTKFDSSKW
jgi:exopolysaccharide biosynthesis protein